MTARPTWFLNRLATWFPTATQIGASILRVLAFGWAALQIEQLPQHADLLQFVGYLPYFGIFDVLCQSWSRSAQIHQAPWTQAIPKRRHAFVVTAVVGLSSTLLMASALPDASAAMLVITVCCLVGSLAFVWERWLAATHRAAAASTIEVFLLLFAVLSYSMGWLNQSVLILCFVSYLLARLLVLLVPGRAASTDALPKRLIGMRQYLGFAIGQQLVGASAAALPSLYAALTGSTAGLAVSLALFRAMHSFAAMASFLINAIGGRLFFGEAPSEMAVIERVSHLLRRWRHVIDGACLTAILGAATFWGPDILIILPAFIVMLAAINFRSSFAFSRGRPKDCFVLQISVFFASLMALFSISAQTSLIWIAAVVYAVYALLSERYLAHPADSSLQTPVSLNNRQP